MSVRVAHRYAKSLFELAIEKNNLPKVEQGMVLIHNVCEENRSLVVLLKNPVIRFDYKLNVLKRLFGKKVDPLIIRFMDLICRKNRSAILPDVAKDFIDLNNEYKGIATAQLISAIPFTDDLRKSIIDLLVKETDKKIILQETVDEKLIGGFILRMGDSQIDNTLSRKLNDLRREFKESK